MPSRRAMVIGGAVLAGVTAIALRRRAQQLAELVLDELDRTEHDSSLDGDELTLTSLDGAELAVSVAGPADGPVVVLAHCWTGSRNTWTPVARRLIAEGCRVVRWDQRGHGKSVAGHKGHTVEGLADDLATVLVELDLHDAVLVGHSMGGMTVQALAAHHPALFAERSRAAVLVATAGWLGRRPLSGPTPNLVRSAYVERLFERPAAGRVMVRSTFGRVAHRHHLETTVTDFLACPGPVRADFARAMAAMDLREGIATIAVPTTILVGSRDTLTPVGLSRILARAIPGSTLDILPGFGHMLPYEAPGRVAQAILEHVAAPRVSE